MIDTKPPTPMPAGCPPFELTELIEGIRQIICLHCGSGQRLAFPLSLPELARAIQLFTLLHHYCARHPEVTAVH